MVDLGTFRPFIVVVSFLGFSVLLIGLIPTEFYSSSEEMRGVSTPDAWESSNLPALDYAEVVGYNMTWVAQYIDNFEIGNRWLMIQWYAIPSPHIKIYHRFGLVVPWLPYPTQYAEMDWWQNGLLHSDNQITAETLNDDYDDNGLEGLQYLLREGEVQVQVSFDFDQDLYASPLQAWQDDNLIIQFGITWDYVGTAFNAWDIISMLLFFKLPNVHWAINAILSIPIWASVAIIAYTIITGLIPFIRGT